MSGSLRRAVARRCAFARACGFLLGCAALLEHAAHAAPPSPAPTSSASPSTPAPPAVSPGVATSTQSPDEPKHPLTPADVRGIETPAVDPGDGWRRILDAVLFGPRKMIELLFLAGGTAAGLLRDEQVVPRVAELVSPPVGHITLFPTFFFDTRGIPDVGGRLLARGRFWASSLGAGFGGLHDLNTEQRLRFTSLTPVPLVFAADSLFDERSTLQFRGLGQQPGSDPRNHFLPHAATGTGLYLETRARVIGSIGARVFTNFEVFLSSSLLLSHIEDTPGANEQAFSRVFAPGSVSGGLGNARYEYTELALRLDTRPTLGQPVPGVLLETYGGAARGLNGTDAHFMRTGGRAALFIPVKYPWNIISPKLTLDGVWIPAGGSVPFQFLSSEPDYRGLDNRKDILSAVASVDYRWRLVRYVGARLFTDFATVAPDLGALFKFAPRFAGGFGIDLFSDSAQLGTMAISAGSDGVRALLSFGVEQGFGDRQHRN